MRTYRLSVLSALLSTALWATQAQAAALTLRTPFARYYRTEAFANTTHLRPQAAVQHSREVGAWIKERFSR